MKISIDQKKVNRYRKIGQYTSLAALAVLLGGFVIAISQIFTTFQTGTDVPQLDESMLTYSYLAMFIGLVLTQISLYFGNRWGKRESVDQTITNNLKGLDDRYTLYHYTGPVPHLLVGPAGILVLTPMYQAGRITYEGNRYRQSGVRFFSRLFGQEGIGRPDLEAQGYLQDLERFMQKNLPEGKPIEPVAAIVFTNPKANLHIEGAPYPTMMVDKLKDFVRRKAKEQMASMDKLQPLLDVLPDAD
jgi:hypothetical protein